MSQTGQCRTRINGCGAASGISHNAHVSHIKITPFRHIIDHTVHIEHAVANHGPAVKKGVQTGRPETAGFLIHIFAVNAHGTLFQTDGGNAPFHTADGKVAVAFHRDRRHFIVPVNGNGCMHPGGVSLKADERTVGGGHIFRQTQINVIGEILFHLQGDFFNGAVFTFPFPETFGGKVAPGPGKTFRDSEFIGQILPQNFFDRHVVFPHVCMLAYRIMFTIPYPQKNANCFLYFCTGSLQKNLRHCIVVPEKHPAQEKKYEYNDFCSRRKT